MRYLFWMFPSAPVVSLDCSPEMLSKLHLSMHLLSIQWWELFPFLVAECDWYCSMCLLQFMLVGTPPSMNIIYGHASIWQMWPRKSITVMEILAPKEILSLSLHSNWLRPLCLQWVSKGYLVLVSQQEGTDGFLWTKQHGVGSCGQNSRVYANFKGWLLVNREVLMVPCELHGTVWALMD